MSRGPVSSAISNLRSSFWYPPDLRKMMLGPRWLQRLVFKNVRAHDAFLGVPEKWFGGHQKILEKFFRAVGIRFWSACEFRSSFGVGCGRGPGRNRGPMMHGGNKLATGTPPLIRPCRRGPGRSPCLEVFLNTGWRRLFFRCIIGPPFLPGPLPDPIPRPLQNSHALQQRIHMARRDF